jgi:hypothetical protein
MEILRSFDKITAGFSNRAPRYFREMVGNIPETEIDGLWLKSRNSRDWRIVKGAIHRNSGLSKSLFVIKDDVDRANLNSFFKGLILNGVRLTGNPPLELGQ